MIGENIKAIRKNKGMTQEELAIKLNVARQTISKWEKRAFCSRRRDGAKDF